MSCHKLAFHSVEQAERTLEIIQSQGMRDPATTPKRLYLCPNCGCWHWTSIPQGTSESVMIRAPEPPPVREAIHKESPRNSKSSARSPLAYERARRTDLEDNLRWARNVLRDAVSRYLKERSAEAASYLAAVANNVVSFPARGRFDDPEVAEWLEGNLLAKLAWLRDTQESTARGK